MGFAFTQDIFLPPERLLIFYITVPRSIVNQGLDRVRWNGRKCIEFPACLMPVLTTELDDDPRDPRILNEGNK
jgi:hypothetical protein